MWGGNQASSAFFLFKDYVNLVKIKRKEAIQTGYCPIQQRQKNHQETSKVGGVKPMREGSYVVVGFPFLGQNTLDSQFKRRFRKEGVEFFNLTV